MSNIKAASCSSSVWTEEDLTEDHPPTSYPPSGRELKKGIIFFISTTGTHTHTLIPDTPRKVDPFITAHMKQSHSSAVLNARTHTHRSHGGCTMSSLLYTLTAALSKYSPSVSNLTLPLLAKHTGGPKVQTLLFFNKILNKNKVLLTKQHDGSITQRTTSFVKQDMDPTMQPKYFPQYLILSNIDISC